MKITQDVREYAARHGVGDAQALEQGLREKSDEFRQNGGEVYVPEEDSRLRPDCART